MSKYSILKEEELKPKNISYSFSVKLRPPTVKLGILAINKEFCEEFIFIMQNPYV